MTETNIAALLELLKIWSAKAVEDFGAQCVYLFGSLIHKNGEQFSDSSDIDLVIVMPSLNDAAARHRWLLTFREHLETLEYQVMRLLKRTGSKPSVSVVVATQAELTFNLHKDGHREFFTENTFRNLVSNEERKGIISAVEIHDVSRFIAASLPFAQKIRNEYLSVSANGTCHLEDYDESDPLPKRIMRAAAMAARAIERTKSPGAEHDVKEGLDLLSHELYIKRNDNQQYEQLHNQLSVRRRARGNHEPITSEAQLLLAEIIFDIVMGASSLDGAKSQAVSPSDDSHNRFQAEFEEKGSAAANPEPWDRNIRTTMPLRSSTAFFHERFAFAFPGLRESKWVENIDEIASCLSKLLKAPLMFTDGTPIWWWRGGNLQIENFKRLDSEMFLMNVEELKIVRIAAVPGRTYERSFVYVRADGLPPTGLYPAPQSGDSFPYTVEEYGLVDGEKLITRAEYDDGYANINGQTVDVARRSELRVRHTSPYNFVIAAQSSPINNPKFDEVLAKTLDTALVTKENETPELLQSLVNNLPGRQSIDF